MLNPCRWLFRSFGFALVPISNAFARDLTVVAAGRDEGRVFTPCSKDKKAPLLEASYTGGIAKTKGAGDHMGLVQMDAMEMILPCGEEYLEHLDWAKPPGSGQIMGKAKADCGVGAFVWSKMLAYDGDKMI
ncbi:hypothetical protein [Mesorhizobium sp. M6A.T.Ce.TU.016.01.1.1]|uniref:hypothetical protein n=1 Tax=Mesorhizobium sp. M6A.T.Ce.TU.016.01.1.1 TaxID=2496783 RepID=UPI000FCC3E71|nr:hypothetical protein [Mesorhizobium sp. M6A.T.Ce.TU.016.01.1.1]RUU25103.1 hypothetical protein EOC94_32835 [Mesorhizobium sp. M6A.T.Ce.TU.016.01.1.1]